MASLILYTIQKVWNVHVVGSSGIAQRSKPLLKGTNRWSGPGFDPWLFCQKMKKLQTEDGFDGIQTADF